MDLVSAPNSRVVVAMHHTATNGAPKIVSECTLPLTGSRVADRIITDLAVFDCDKKGEGGLTLVEIAPGVTIEKIQEATACSFKVADDLRPMLED